MKKVLFDKKDLFLIIFMLSAPVLLGGFHTVFSCVYSVALFCYLTVKRKELSEHIFTFSFEYISIAIIVLFYLLSSFWATDSPTAIYGFFKFLPVLLFTVAVKDKENDEKNRLLNVIPYSAAIISAVTYPLSFIPSLSQYLLVAGRFGGAFQSPNAYALFCVCAIVILLTNEKITAKDWVCLFVLVASVFLTGSRTVFIILVICVIFFVIVSKNKNVKIMLSVITGMCIAVGTLFVLITENTDTIGRFLTISLESSTLWGRLLYAKDALGIIIKHPFGLGYYGYRFLQGSVQTGVYSVSNVHNEILQMFIDIGWIPAVIFCVTLVRSFISKNNSLRSKVLMAVIVVHSLFDFDLQFVYIWFVLILCIDFKKIETKHIKVNEKPIVVIMAAMCAVGVYFGVVNGAFICGNYRFVEKIYGADTQSEMNLMMSLDNYAEMNKYADSIIKRNKYVSLAYSVKANFAFEQGDFENFILYKTEAIKCSKYDIDEYNDYAQKLLYGMNLYLQYGDGESASYCAEKLLEIPGMLEEVKENTSKSAWKIQDKPQFQLDAVLTAEIEKVKAGC